MTTTPPSERHKLRRTDEHRALPLALADVRGVPTERDAVDIIELCQRIAVKSPIRTHILGVREDLVGEMTLAAVKAWKAWDGRGDRLAYVAISAKRRSLDYIRWVTAFDRTAKQSRLKGTEPYRDDVDREGRRPHAQSEVPAPDAALEAESTTRRQVGILAAMLSTRHPTASRVVSGLLSGGTQTAAAEAAGITEGRVTQVLASLRAQAQSIPIN